MERPLAVVGSEVELFESSASGLRAQAASAAREMLRQGHTTLTIGLDNLSAVGDAVVAAVIVALRIVREFGGTIRLRTQKSEHRHQLTLNGLDRFVIVLDCADDVRIGGPGNAHRRQVGAERRRGERRHSTGQERGPGKR